MRYCLPAVVLTLVFGLLSPLPARAQAIVLPDFGDPSQQYLSSADELHLGSAVLQRLRDQNAVIDDVQLNEYLASVGQQIAAYADTTGNPYTFFWVDDPAINAFAAPGGFIGVYSGLMLATENEDELAGVIAHEISHINQHHIARAFADTRRMTIPMAAAMVASMLLASANSNLGGAALAGTMAVGAQRQISFTRANEQEADRIGSQLLAKSGYDPDGMASFFARLGRLSGTSAAQVPEFLRTHPLPTNRLADIQNRFAERPGGHSNRDDLAYHLAKIRLKVLTTPNTGILIRELDARLNSGDYKNETAEHYGYALALKRAGRYDEAQRQVEWLLKRDPDRLAFRLEAADIALAKGDQARGWRLFEETKRLYSDDFTLAIYYGQALTVQGDPHKAMTILQPHLRRHPTDLPLHALYAQAAQRAGDVGATHAALAEYYYLSGELKLAIQQLELGLRNSSTTSYQQAQLRARLRELKEELENSKRY